MLSLRHYLVFNENEKQSLEFLLDMNELEHIFQANM